jgi:hypothetical protein
MVFKFASLLLAILQVNFRPFRGIAVMFPLYCIYVNLGKSYQKHPAPEDDQCPLAK